jgi:hypothetical protein
MQGGFHRYHFVKQRYCILAPNAVPQGFVDGKVVTEKVMLALQLDPAEYKLGNTKVFFKAGVLGINMTGAISGAGTVHPSGAPEFTAGL